jgi:DNA replication licensing factor MCM7
MNIPKLDFEPLTPQFIRSYISYAKRFSPKLPRELHNFIITRYVEKRKLNLESKAGYAYTTPRTLL